MNDVPDAVHVNPLQESNNADIQLIHHGISAMRDGCGMMSKEEYCVAMSRTNQEERELILEVIYRLHFPPCSIQPI